MDEKILKELMGYLINSLSMIVAIAIKIGYMTSEEIGGLYDKIRYTTYYDLHLLYKEETKS